MKMKTAIEKECSKCVAYERDCGGCVRPGTINPKYRRSKSPKDGTWIVGWWKGKPKTAGYIGGEWMDAEGRAWDGDPSKWMLLP